ncbi:hypothetical protein [Paraclostridium bifermentans]|uniref:hypothetical protein n=1 Tax=Paraclostridium bifermentans TaxID=1490 RepID=UPI00374EC612
MSTMKLNLGENKEEIKVEPGYISCIKSENWGVFPIGFASTEKEAVQLCRDAYTLMECTNSSDYIFVVPTKNITAHTMCNLVPNYFPTREACYGKILKDTEYYISKFNELSNEEKTPGEITALKGNMETQLKFAYKAFEEDEITEKHLNNIKQLCESIID